MSVLDFRRDGDLLILQYQPTHGWSWLDEKLKSVGKATVRSVFHVTTDLQRDQPPKGEDFYDYELEPLEFEIGKVENDYFHLYRDVLGIDYDLKLSHEIDLETRHFVAVRDISIFGRLGEFKPSSIHIGGNHEGAIPVDVFHQLITDFPDSTEVTKYARARIDAILGEYLTSPKDLQADFEKHVNGKGTWKGSLPRTTLAPYEGDKFSALVYKLTQMLNGVDDYNETRWQEEILQILLLLFPVTSEPSAKGQ